MTLARLRKESYFIGGLMAVTAVLGFFAYFVDSTNQSELYLLVTLLQFVIACFFIFTTKKLNPNEENTSSLFKLSCLAGILFSLVYGAMFLHSSYKEFGLQLAALAPSIMPTVVLFAFFVRFYRKSRLIHELKNKRIKGVGDN